MPLTQKTFAALVLEDTDGRWELHGGKLREKPEMSFGHNEAVWELARQLMPQLPRASFRVRLNAGHLTIPGGDSYIPDLIVVPVVLITMFQADPRKLEAYSDPLPFVVEVWSPSTGSYDIDRKIPGYQARGDLEIWRIHPFDRVVTSWRKSDIGYDRLDVRGGSVTLHAIPNVTIDLDLLLGQE